MARWKLTEPHYLSVPSERWEHTTTDSRTGKPIRKMYRVPKHLDPRLEDDWTHRPENNNMDGEIIVCWEGKGKERDIIFEGNPTPGMLPLDDEAKEVSSRFSWTPTQGIDEDSQRQSFYARLGDTLIDQMTELKVARETAPSNPGLVHGNHAGHDGPEPADPRGPCREGPSRSGAGANHRRGRAS